MHGAAQAETLIKNTLLERSQLTHLNADLAAERSRASEAESARERVAGELAVRLRRAVCVVVPSCRRATSPDLGPSMPSSPQASEAARDALQAALKDVKQQLWESEEHSQTQCAPTTKHRPKLAKPLRSADALTLGLQGVQDSCTGGRTA